MYIGRTRGAICKLNKSIYGLKQSAWCWNTALHKKLDDMGFVQSTSDPCVYKKDSGGDIFIIGVYVNEIVLAGRTDKEMRKSRLLLLLHLTSRIWAISFTIFLV